MKKYKDQLKEIEKEYEEFAYIVSHDLSSPFRHIEGFLRLATKDKTFDEKTEKYFNTIQNSLKEGKTMLNCLLEFSRLNTERAPFEDIDITLLVSHIIDQLKNTSLYSEKTVLHIDPLPTLKGNKKQLHTAFYQLLLNAFQYHKPHTPPHISLTCKERKKHWEFRLQDNGVGIDPSLHDKIFKVLRRAVRQDEYPGQGMGLALTKKIIQLHGGSIRVQSHKNKGATFIFTLEKH